MLTVLSTLGPHRLDAGRCTVTSRFRCRSYDRRYVVGALSTGRCLPAVAPRVLIMGDEVRTRSFSPDNHFTLLQVTAPRITRNGDRPRASNKTMVDTQLPDSRPSFKTRLAWSPPEDETCGTGKQTRAKPLDRKREDLSDSGLDLETKIFSASGRGRSFFLTIPFNRTS